MKSQEASPNWLASTTTVESILGKEQEKMKPLLTLVATFITSRAMLQLDSGTRKVRYLAPVCLFQGLHKLHRHCTAVQTLYMTCLIILHMYVCADIPDKISVKVFV